MKKFTLNTHMLVVEGKKKLHPTGSVPVSELLTNKKKEKVIAQVPSNSPKSNKSNSYPIVSFNLYGTPDELITKIVQNAAFALACAENPKDVAARGKELVAKFIK